MAEKAAKYTFKRRPVALVYAEEFDRIDEAYYREKQVQGWSRRKKRALIEERGDDLPPLSRSGSHQVALPEPVEGARASDTSTGSATD